jgi:hypothetical protein
VYKFSKQLVGGFVIYTSTPSINEVHYKKFSGIVSPSTQETLNIYLEGTFLIRCGKFEQILYPGQTSLDIQLETYTPEQVYAEKAITTPAKRFCVSKEAGGSWQRQRVLVDQNWITPESGILIYFDGTVLPIVPERVYKSGQAIFCK